MLLSRGKLGGFVPVHIGPKQQYHTVRWMEASSEEFGDPFFAETVTRLRSRLQPHRELETELAELIKIGNQLPLSPPAGFIFNMTRCGSTLLLNALKKIPGVLGLSEAQPMVTALRRARVLFPHRTREATDLAISLVNTLAHAENSQPMRVIYKGVLPDIRCLAVIRSVWPEVPCAVLIRNPTDVLISNLQGPPPWLTMRKHSPSEQHFPECPPEIRSAGDLEFLSWSLGQYCSTALEMIDDRCTVLDYDDLSIDTVMVLAERFDLKISAELTETLRQTFLVNSKSPRRGYTSDREAKQQAVTAAIREAADSWIEPHYRKLKECNRRLACK